MAFNDTENRTSSMLHQRRIEGVKNVASRAALGSGVQRRPLGVVNFHPEKMANVQSVMKPQMLESKVSGKKSEKSDERCSSTRQTLKTSSTTLTVARTHFEDTDIENMIACPDVDEDDFHDLWPVSEQPATYIKNIMSWYPPVHSGCCDYDKLPISPPSAEMLLDGTDEEETSSNYANGGKPVQESPPPQALDFDVLALSLPPIDEDMEYLSCLN